MSSLNDPDNFAGRVAYAASVIGGNRPQSRAFDNCFENNDGDEVSAILLRRAEKNPKLKANMPRYLNMDIITECAAKLAHVSTRDMPAHAAATRARCKVKFDKWLAEQQA